MSLPCGGASSTRFPRFIVVQILRQRVTKALAPLEIETFANVTMGAHQDFGAGALTADGDAEPLAVFDLIGQRRHQLFRLEASFAVGNDLDAVVC